MSFTAARPIFLTLFFSSTIMACTAVTNEQNTSATDSIDNWSLFVEDNPKVCWAQTALDAQRLTVFSSPDEGISEQVVFSAGFPILNASLRIDGGKVFRLRSRGRNAWTKSPSDDIPVVRSLKSGSRAVVTATHASGKRVKSVFSLRGAAEVISQATRLCSP